jgi:hypothetical protein
MFVKILDRVLRRLNGVSLESDLEYRLTLNWIAEHREVISLIKL